jgi:hypothetical protein
MEDHVAAAKRFWNLLDRPKTSHDWDVRMKPLLEASEMTLDDFKKFLYWVVNVNEYSVEYLRKANDPMASLAKNIHVLLKFYKAAEARQKAAAGNRSTQNEKGPSQMSYEFNKEKLW